MLFIVLQFPRLGIEYQQMCIFRGKKQQWGRIL
jgi:hypothetical protein